MALPSSTEPVTVIDRAKHCNSRQLSQFSPQMKRPRQLLACLGEVLLGQSDPVRHRGGLTGPPLVDGVGLDAALLGAQTRHFYSLRHLIDLGGERSFIDVTWKVLSAQFKADCSTMEL